HGEAARRRQTPLSGTRVDAQVKTTMDQSTEDIELSLLLDAIYRKYNYDFRYYAMASIKRRMKQAKERFSCHSYSALQDLVLHDESVLPALLSYLTVQVSEMFRDP